MSKWIEQVTPNEYVASIYDIDLDKLWNDGKRLILTDLDNTLVPWNHPTVPSGLTNWLKQAEQIGFQVCILSNNSGERVREFSEKSGIPAISKARKPLPQGFQRALEHFHVPASKAVMVGDQLFTDIRGGNLCGLYTILVLPIHPREYWGTKINRQFEKFAMKRLVRRGLVVPERKSND